MAAISDLVSRLDPRRPAVRESSPLYLAVAQMPEASNQVARRELAKQRAQGALVGWRSWIGSKPGSE